VVAEDTATTAAEMFAIAGAGRKTFISYLAARKTGAEDGVPSHG